MSAACPTPTDLKIKPRDLAFSRGVSAGRHWLAEDPVATAFYNALSATFPLGERFFMDSVRRYRHCADPTLDQQISAFLTQEAIHTREHAFFNQQVADGGYDLGAMEARTKARIDFARTRPPLMQLAATAALEHVTAILANAILKDDRHLRGAKLQVRAMWRWHAIEEIEHKSVAFDTLAIASAGLPPWRRWLMRSTIMMLATGLLISSIGANMAEMLRADGLELRRSWRRVASYLLVSPGVLRQVTIPYLAYFAPGFHPWAKDDRDLIKSAELELQQLAAV